MVSSNACSLIGSTMPVVPRMEMPPSMPRRGLKVFFASASPSGAEIVTSMPPSYPTSMQTSRTFSSIIFRGTELIAAAPTGWSSPGFITRPTPSPPSMVTPGVADFLTAAKMSVPRVTSGSSPLSFRMAQRTSSASI